MTETSSIAARRTHVTTPAGLTFELIERGPTAGPIVVALHGFPQSAQSWAVTAEKLAAAGFRVITFDQRGYAPASRAPLDAYRLDDVVGDVLDLADAAGLGRFHVAGFGMGAVQAWQLAATAPARVLSLTALRFPHPRAFAEGVEQDAEQREAWESLEAMSPPVPAARALLADNARGMRDFLTASGMPPDLVSATVARLDEDTLAAAIAWHLIPIERMAQVDPVEVPCLYVWTEGPALMPATAARCRAHITGPFREVRLEGVGHWILETAPELLAPVLIAHLREFEVS